MIRHRRAVFAGGFLLLAAMVFTAAAFAFLWPNIDDRTFDLGPLDQFPPDTVTTYNRLNGAPLLSRDGRVLTNEAFHIVRLEDGEIRALSSKDPHLGCAVPWRPDFAWDGETGFFRNPCHGETFDMAGNRVFGPSPRGLDRFRVEIENGRVVVDLGDVTLGPRGSRASASDATPAATATPAPPTATPSASASGTPTMVTHIDWVDFIRLGGVSYLRAGPWSAIDDEDLGPEFAQVRFRLSENVTDPFYQAKDGDAAFLDAKTPVYEVRGYAPTFRLAARRNGRLLLYEADSNPAATTGGDLLDIGGKVDYIGVNSASDGRTELAAIDDADEVATLVELLLAAPVDQDNRDHEGQRYFIAFHLADGTEVARSYWLESGELSRGIMLPPEFATAVERALRGDQ